MNHGPVGSRRNWFTDKLGYRQMNYVQIGSQTNGSKTKYFTDKLVHKQNATDKRVAPGLGT